MRLATASASLLMALSMAGASTQIEIPGPPGSGEFGRNVIVLANGNFVVTDRLFDAPGAADAGAVYLYSPEGALISSLRGGTAGDQVGSSGIVVLANGHFVVRSPGWNGNQGAVTWGSAETGFGGAEVTVSTANSLTGATADNYVGYGQVAALNNGHYVVASPNWDNGTAQNAGAVTWGDGNGGTTGPVSSANSLTGSTAEDQVGIGVSALSNGHYVVSTPTWDNDGIVNAGAVTWGDGNGGTAGPVSSANSLHGTTAEDQVGGQILPGNQTLRTRVTVLNNGHYVVASPNWDNAGIVNAGAVTWCDGSTGLTGPVSTANSLHGSTNNALTGNGGITVLSNNHYLATSAGRVVWSNGNGGATSPVTNENSLFGPSGSGSGIYGFGVYEIVPLTNGHYVLHIGWQKNGTNASYRGAVWYNGNSGASGEISLANALATPSDTSNVSKVTALSNGHYVFSNTFWGGWRGAVTWCNGFIGKKGTVSAANSLVGVKTHDEVGSRIVPLSNGHYVVSSPYWKFGSVNAASGAATWCNGFTGSKGKVTAANSLVGTQDADYVGIGTVQHASVNTGVIALSNGNYIVCSPLWNNGSILQAGAITWGDGNGGATGPVSTANSLTGTQTNDRLGSVSLNSYLPTVIPLEDGNAIIRSYFWNNGGITDPGAITFIDGSHGFAGLIDGSNSVLGTTGNGSTSLAFDYDPVHQQVIVGKPSQNRIVIFSDLIEPPRTLLTLARSTTAAPGAVDIAYGKPGLAVLFNQDQILFETGLIGSGASKGRNRAVFSSLGGTGLDLVLQKGADLSGIAGLPSGAKVASLLSPTLNQSGLGIFQATVTGKGIAKTSNRLLFKDDGAALSPLLRTGNPVAALGNAVPGALLEVAQHYVDDVVAVAYTLQSNPALDVGKGNDSGILLLDHNGAVLSALVREGGEIAPGGPVFGQFTGKVSLGDDPQTAFTAGFVPAGETKPKNGIFSTDGAAITAGQATGDPAPETETGTTFSTFTALNVQDGTPLLRATLKGGSKKQNEGIWRGGNLLLRKASTDIGGGVQVAKILKFWPVGADQLVVQAQLTGAGVKSGNNQALLLRQADGDWQFLLRTGDPAPGASPATVAKISAVEVERLNGHYAVLATLKGVPASANQALWAGQTTLGDDDSAASERRPRLLLKKGDLYKTTQTPMGLIRGITLAPIPDKTGAGTRGQGQVIGSDSSLLITLLGDHKVTEQLIIQPPEE